MIADQRGKDGRLNCKMVRKQEEKDKVIEINVKSQIRFSVVYHKFEKEVRGGYLKKRLALIVLKDKKTGKEMVHPFTEYVIKELRSVSIKTQIDYSRNISTFLNYYIDNGRKFGINNFSELKYYHLSYFLNYYCGCLARNTVINYKNVLSKFYFFLSKEGFLIYCKPEDFIVKEKVLNNGRAINIVEAPLPELDLPEAKVRSRNEHDMSPELQSLFLEVAFEEVNIIALGVALQMFAGLRMSEVIRLRYSLIRSYGYYGEKGMLFVLKEDDDGTRPELKNNQGKGYIKRPRIQEAICPPGLISELMKRQRKKYKPKDGSDAVFVNSDGKAMSYGSYRYYFGKLKKIFLKRLGNSENPILKMQKSVLESRRWSTHIGRGIFSNNLVEVVDNPVLIQLLRGDTDSSATGIYIGNSKRIGKQFEKNTENTYVELINKISGGNKKYE